MGVLSPKIGLGITALLFLLFAFGAVVVPSKLLSNYNIDIATLTGVEQMLLTEALQQVGMCFFIVASFCTVSIRTAGDDQLATTALMAGLGGLIQQAVNAASVSYYSDLGASATAQWVTLAVFVVVAILCLLGADVPPAIKVSPISKPLYWGFLANIVLLVIYIIPMAFTTEAFFESYGMSNEVMPSTGKAYKLLIGTFKYNMTSTCGLSLLLNLAHIITFSPQSTYVIGRGFTIIYFAFFIKSAAYAAVYSALNVNGPFTSSNTTNTTNTQGGKLDKIVTGEIFNMGLWFVFWALFYAPIVMLDGGLKGAVEQGLGAGDGEDLESDYEEDGDLLGE